LEFDLALNEMIMHQSSDVTKFDGKMTEQDVSICLNVAKRVSGTAYKRFNPLNLQHPMDSMRFKRLEGLDSQF
jgi:hypothetical protein